MTSEIMTLHRGEGGGGAAVAVPAWAPLLLRGSGVVPVAWY